MIKKSLNDLKMKLGKMRTDNSAIKNDMSEFEESSYQ